jgi:hypothetical protein
VARYFSQAHLYLNGTNWLTSVCPLMMRLSAALTLRAVGGVVDGADAACCAFRTAAAAPVNALTPVSAGVTTVGDAMLGMGFWGVGRASGAATSSFQDSM